MIKKLICVLLVLCFPLMVIGQTSSESSGRSNDDSLQSLANYWVVASQAAPVRAKPPSGFFRRVGKPLGETIPAKQYKISKWKTLPYLFTTQTWVELAEAGDENRPIGWVYWGEKEIPQPGANFNFMGASSKN